MYFKCLNMIASSADMLRDINTIPKKGPRERLALGPTAENGTVTF